MIRINLTKNTQPNRFTACFLALALLTAILTIAVFRNRTVIERDPALNGLLEVVDSGGSHAVLDFDDFTIAWVNKDRGEFDESRRKIIEAELKLRIVKLLEFYLERNVHSTGKVDTEIDQVTNHLQSLPLPVLKR